MTIIKKVQPQVKKKTISPFRRSPKINDDENETDLVFNDEINSDDDIDEINSDDDNNEINSDDDNNEINSDDDNNEINSLSDIEFSISSTKKTLKDKKNIKR